MKHAPWLYLLWPLCLMAPAAVWAQDEPEASDFEHHMEQARLFVKKGWLKDAADEARAASQSTDAAQSSAASLLLAQVCYELGDLECTYQAAFKAKDAPKAEISQQALQLSSFLESSFGIVQLSSKGSSTLRRIAIEREGFFVDPELKQAFERQQRFAKQRVSLPVTLWLPAGEYHIGHDSLRVTSSSSQGITLGGLPVSDWLVNKLHAAEWGLGLGTSHAFSKTTGHWFPSVNRHAEVVLPLGRWFAAFSWDWTPKDYLRLDRLLLRNVNHWSLGGQVGLRSQQIEPLEVRASLSVRTGPIGGLAVLLSEDKVSYGSSWATTPGLALQARVMEELGRIQVGFGVGVFAEITFVPLENMDVSSNQQLALATGNSENFAQGQRLGYIGVRTLPTLFVSF
jgi:hypothetical protein